MKVLKCGLFKEGQIQREVAEGMMEVIRADVEKMVCFGLTRICGGGINDERPSSEFLEKLAKESISFPNKKFVSYSEDLTTCLPGTQGDGDIGKPHDIEVRAALKIYHKFKKSTVTNFQRAQNFEDFDDSPDIGCLVSPMKRRQDQMTSSVALTSDMGLNRVVLSPQQLADHLANIMEELMLEQVFGEEGSQLFDSNTRRDRWCRDIKVDASGIICLTTCARAEELQIRYGRLSCPSCLVWCKGTKGLWWHQQQEHNFDHSHATNSAALSSGVHSRALILRPSNVAERYFSKEKPKVKEEVNVNEDHIDIFMDVIRSGKLPSVESLVNSGKFNPLTYVDKNKANAIHWAAGCGHLDLAKYLIEVIGCSPHISQGGKRSFGGRTPLHWASRNGHLPVVKYLVEICNVDIEAVTADGTTSFCWAAWQGHLDIMSFLIKSGCNINTSNSFGCNAALWCAQGSPNMHALKLLQENGCDLLKINNNGHGVLHKAAQRGNKSVCDWLFPVIEKSRARSSAFEWSIHHIGPDGECCCPSDLCGIEGHTELAYHIAELECQMVKTLIVSPLPQWLSDAIDAERSSNGKYRNACIENPWGPGCGARRMAIELLSFDE